MIFAAPWLLLALAALPALWWLLRVTPPAPRRQDFPSVRLLLDLPADQTSARTPLWLLALRMAAAALLIFGLAGPILGGHKAAPSQGVQAVVLDDDFAAATDWPSRIAAADRVLSAAEQAGRSALLLTTARAGDGAAPSVRGPMPAGELRAVLPTLQPRAWPPDRLAASQALDATARDLRPGIGSVAYIADGLAHGAGWETFAAALEGAGPVTVLADPAPPAGVLTARTTAEGWNVRLAQVPRTGVSELGVRAEAADGRVLARAPLRVGSGAASGTAELDLPTELRNRVDRLTLEAAQGGAVASAASMVLLDEADRRHPVGLLESQAPGAHTPLTGSAYFLRRALAPYAEWREGSLDALLARPLSVLLAADTAFGPGTDADTLRGWIERGGTLIRFAGPDMAEAAQEGRPDPLLPVPLLPAERQIGGSMSWGKPAALAPFPANSPFAGLEPAHEAASVADPDAPPSVGDSDVTVSRQVLADPAADLGSATWARLADGTPLVTQRALGAGRIVLFHVTANADWSNLPLSGLFVDMLRRLLARSTGVAADKAPGGDLAPVRTLDAFGAWTSPQPAARPIEAARFAATVAGPAHPPGLYGPEGGRRVSEPRAGPAGPAGRPGADRLARGPAGGRPGAADRLPAGGAGADPAAVRRAGLAARARPSRRRRDRRHGPAAGPGQRPGRRAV